MVLRASTFEVHKQGEATTEQEVTSYFGPQNDIGMVATLAATLNFDRSMTIGSIIYGSFRVVRSVLLHRSHPFPEVGATMAGRSAFSPRDV